MLEQPYGGMDSRVRKTLQALQRTLEGFDPLLLASVQ
jgi:hypothetical protein